jgi:hypothetical protein
MGKVSAWGGTQADILVAVEAYPGSTTQELINLLPHLPKSSVQTTVSTLFRRKKLRLGEPKLGSRGGLIYSYRTYHLNDGSVPSTPKPTSLKAPPEAGLKVRLEQAQAEIEELRAWKEAAMSRFPDLAVSAVVIKARKIVADEVRAGGDTLLANQIVSGLKDSTLMVRVALKALEDVA